MALSSLALLPAPAASLASSLSSPNPVIAAAGDISCAQGPDGSSNCRDQATSDLLVNQGLSRVLGLGDQQYDSGALSDFNSYYDQTWGRVKEITSPSPGNHDPYSSGYSAYFGSRAPARYYSYDIGPWHLISLDSNNPVDAAQVSWLHSDLAANAAEKCVLAYWHHPRFSSGSIHGSSTRSAPFWTELYNVNADLVLTGHDHVYERFAPQDPNGVRDDARGIREFVVGTGGRSHYGFGPPEPNSEVRESGSYGVLELTLRPGAYDWQFVPEAGTFSDSGTGICHSAADLSLAKSDSPDPVLAGQLLTYTLTAQNSGPSSASGVTLTETLPAGVTFDSASASQGGCSQSSGTVTCNLGSLANSASATATISVRPQGAGALMNNASVGSTTSDPTSSNNQASAGTTVDPAADLSLAKSDSPDPVLAGQLLTYTITATNDGPSDATGVVLTDTLPAGVLFDSASASQGGCSQSSGTVTCNLGSLANSASATATISVRPQGPGALMNNASVGSSTSDPTSSNNQASAGTTVDPAADLSLTKSDSPDPLLVGELLTYTLTATNDGPSGAIGVVITDTLPVGPSFESASASQGVCLPSVETVSCFVGTLASGATATATIAVRPRAQGTITNSAAVESSVADPGDANNQATEQTTVDPLSDLSLTQSDTPDPVRSGEVLTYTVSALNLGPSSASGVALSDTLPKSVKLRSARSERGRCLARGRRRVDCNLGELASGDSATVTIVVRPTRKGTYANTASVRADPTDPNSLNNQASELTIVNPAPGT